MGVNEDGDGAFQQAFCVPAVPLHENVLMGGERSWGAQGSTNPRVLTPPNRAFFSWAIAQDRGQAVGPFYQVPLKSGLCVHKEK